jgi:DNA-binding NarL/FixJ family response regulator
MSTDPINAPSLSPSLLRILVVDDHCLIREGLTLRIEAEHGMRVVGSVASGEEAVAATHRLRPDVIIMDLVLPSLNGIDATRQILRAYPETFVVALSACHSLEQVRRSVRAGAHAYLLKSAAGNELMDAIRIVIAGKKYLSRELIELHGESVLQGASRANPIAALSDRERQILLFLIAGLTSATIARRLSLSSKTIETYRSRLMTKLDVADRAALIQLAKEYELPDP